MMLTANSCLSLLLFGCLLLSANIFTLKNDLQQIEYEDSQCLLRAYVIYVLAAQANYSFIIQSMYRYVTAVYPHSLYWQTVKLQLIIICFAWVIAIIFPFEFIFRDEVLYNVNNQICQLPIRPTFSMFYAAHCIYIIPMLIIMLIYLKLVLYVQKIGKRVALATRLFRAQRELKMVRRIVILITILLLVGFPYALFVFMSIFTTIPIYHYRIAFLFINLSLTLVSIVLFISNDPLKTAFIKKLKRPTNSIAVITT